ncbi:MAG TPA: ABC transporter substrate-binding protein [Baekduia sp.]|uniref:taurine ABC transporter substrate-binding protein n=1 Tax=Baekduia sp. TaxID=2600305 RepID=UPI002D78F7EE|nr:ABC transporter substrate-binding protein [Baekduia sp.]HET6506793.1 ABC transporter substrate-binding protein [Baekduia sp.]
MMNHRLGVAGLLTAAALGLAACGSDDKGGDQATAAAKANAPAAPKTITIAYQAIPNGDLVVKHEGWLEQALPGTKIEWKLFDSGGAVNEAVAAGSVDIGLAGSSPVSRGLSQPLPYEVPWIHDVIGKAEALVVKKDITSVAQLKGKKVATPLASTSHYSLLAALGDAGLSGQDVKVVDAEPDDIYAAWSRGDIDGAYVWNPNLARIVKDGGHVLVTSEDLAKEGKTTYDLAVVTKDFAGKYPDAVRTWVAQEDRAVKLYRSNPDAAATDVAAELNLGKDEVLPQMKDLIFLDAQEQAGAEYLGGGLAKNLYAAARFNKTLGQIPKVADEASYASAVNATFARGVGG